MKEALIRAEKECTESRDIEPEKVLRPIGTVFKEWVEHKSSTEVDGWAYYKVDEHIQVFRGRRGKVLLYGRCESIVGIEEIEYKQALKDNKDDS